MNRGSVTPIIEIATYAGVDVYECYCRGKESSIVMRRLQDDWINITQVFKVASFSKTQRTKILEKESTEISHQKIQGGYGRFQGTWIPLDNAQNLIAKYEITDVVVHTLINFNPDPMNMPPRRSKNSIIKKLSPATKITSPSSYNKTPKKKIADSSQSTTGSVSKKAKKRASTKAAQPSPLQHLVFQTPQHQAHVQQTQNNYNFLTRSEQTPVNPVVMDAESSDGQRHPHPCNSANMVLSNCSTHNSHITASNTAPVDPTANSLQYATTQKPLQFYPFPVPSSKNVNNMVPDLRIISENPEQKQKTKRPSKHKAVPSGHNFNKKNAIPNYACKMPNFVIMNPTETHKTSNSSGSNTSYGSSVECYSYNDNTTPNSSSSGSSSPKDMCNTKEYKNIILQVLSTEYNTAEPVLPEKLYYPPVGIDVNFLIDKQGHTALHWATAMANVPLMKILLTLEANIFHCNDRGFNCVTKCVFYNNCFRTGAFVAVVGLLKMCLVTPDNNCRLPLHYLVELSVNKAKDPIVISYYIDTILEALYQDDPALLKYCLNCQDNSGNTILHLAALNSSIELCNKFLYLGSSSDVMNNEQLTASAILAKSNLVDATSTITNTPIPSMMPTPATSSVPMLIPAEESFKVKQNKLCTPLRSKKSTNKLDNNVTCSENKRISETTFSETPLLENTTSCDLVQAPSSSISKTLYNSQKALGLDRNTDYNSTPTALVKTPGASPIKALPLPTPSQPYIQNSTRNDRDKATNRNKRPVSNSAVLASEISSLSKALAESYDESILKVKLEITNAEEGLQGISKSIETSDKHVQDVFSKCNANDLPTLESTVKGAQISVDIAMAKFANTMEKLQALALATIVHDEEAHITSTEDTDTSKSDFDITRHRYKQAVQISLLQLKRKQIVQKLIKAKITDHGSKIYKYRKLIGLSIENIDSKLDDIEKDLCSVTV
ncbi:HDL290Cp [Eremothecium sinecaudum]|uniref:HDL290Cp n=1 Tax=Eremothecium sinecaudum TaxID=45286 RepID=A0A0X8HS59_9SACH|nr:HDL290Cp [Eremothecium sinecaudum]AMD20454.1 HDL290Cp [Eremothecium sinecaudum]